MGEVRALYQAGRPTPYHLPAPPSLSPNAELRAASPQLRDWARHLAANSSVITAVLNSRVSGGIGAGLIYEPLVKDRAGNLLTDLNGQIRRVLDLWRRAPDVTGEMSGGELERLLWRCWDTDGEVFVRQVLQRGRDGIPYRVQVVESDMVPMAVVGAGARIDDGILRDEWGRPLTYYVVRDREQIALSAELVQVPAADMRHLKRTVRPGQSRGLTLLHSVIFRVADIAEYMASHRLAARASVDLFAAINRSPDYVQHTNQDGTSPSDVRDWSFEHLQILDGLAPGESVSYLDPTSPNQAAPDFIREELRQVAAGTRSAFSAIALVFDSSYAAQRLEIVQTWRYIEEDRAQLIEDVARPALYEAPLQWAIQSGLVRVPRQADPETLFDVRIDGPTMPVIDPIKDRQAFELDQVNGWDSRHGIIRRMGRSPAAVDAERAQDDFSGGGQDDASVETASDRRSDESADSD